MTDQEKKDTLDNMLICYVDRTYLTNKQIEESEIFVEELRAAISVTRCCTELKSKECPMCNEEKDCEGHNVCEDCGGRSF